jgi:putative addiction module killer protein
MEVRPRTVRIYTTPDGRRPFEEWVDSLNDTKTQTKILDRIPRLRHGNFGDYRQLTGDLYELRVHYGAGYRIYVGTIDSETVLLLWGGSKRTQRRDIQRAKQYWDEFKRRTL